MTPQHLPGQHAAVLSWDIRSNASDRGKGHPVSSDDAFDAWAKPTAVITWLQLGLKQPYTLVTDSLPFVTDSLP